MPRSRGRPSSRGIDRSQTSRVRSRSRSPTSVASLALHRSYRDRTPSQNQYQGPARGPSPQPFFDNPYVEPHYNSFSHANPSASNWPQTYHPRYDPSQAHYDPPPHRLLKQSKSTPQEKPVNSQVLETSRWCFKCHSFDHYSGKCDFKGKSDDNFAAFSLWGFDSFDMDSVALSHDTRGPITSTLQLISHLSHAIRRLNFYKTFVLRRDALFKSALKHCVRDHDIDDQQPVLARSNGVTPWEAYAARSCRFMHTLVKSCHSALIRLHNRGVLLVAEDPARNPDMDANMRGDNEARTANMVQFFQPHIKNMESEARLPKKQIPFMLTVKDIEAYHHAVRNAHDTYQRRMDELTTEWNLLSSTFDLFKPQADASLRQVLSSLPMVDLRATYNLDGEFTINVITFVKVEQLRSYIEDMGDIKIEQEESPHGLGDETQHVSVAQLQEKIASLEVRVEELERVVRRTRDNDEAHDLHPPENVPTQAVAFAHGHSLPVNDATITQDAFNRLFDQRCTQVFGHGVHQRYDQVLPQVTTGSPPRNILQVHPSLEKSTEVSAIEHATGVEKPVSPGPLPTPARSNERSGLEENLRAQVTNNASLDTAT